MGVANSCCICQAIKAIPAMISTAPESMIISCGTLFFISLKYLRHSQRQSYGKMVNAGPICTRWPNLGEYLHPRERPGGHRYIRCRIGQSLRLFLPLSSHTRPKGAINPYSPHQTTILSSVEGVDPVNSYHRGLGLLLNCHPTLNSAAAGWPEYKPLSTAQPECLPRKSSITIGLRNANSHILQSHLFCQLLISAGLEASRFPLNLPHSERTNCNRPSRALCRFEAMSRCARPGS